MWHSYSTIQELKGFEPGDKVIMVNNNRLFGKILPKTQGTIIGIVEKQPPILVAWDDWTDGHNGLAYVKVPGRRNLYFVYPENIKQGSPVKEIKEVTEMAGFKVGDRVISTCSYCNYGKPGRIIRFPSWLTNCVTVSFDRETHGHDGTEQTNYKGADRSCWHLEIKYIVHKPKFKVGDRVVFIMTDGWFPKGTTGTIQNISDKSWMPYYVCPDNGKECLWVEEREIKLLPKKNPYQLGIDCEKYLKTMPGTKTKLIEATKEQVSGMIDLAEKANPELEALESPEGLELCISLIGLGYYLGRRGF